MFTHLITKYQQDTNIFLRAFNLAQNIAIKRYLIVMRHRFRFTNQRKLLKTLTYLGLTFKSFFGWSIETQGSNYLFIFIALLCAKTSSVYRP